LFKIGLCSAVPNDAGHGTLDAATATQVIFFASLQNLKKFGSKIGDFNMFALAR
jgi:hypothetical protein